MFKEIWFENLSKSKAAAEFWKKYPDHQPVDRHRVRKWHISLANLYKVNVVGSHRKGTRLSGPRLNQRVLVLNAFLMLNKITLSVFENSKISISRNKIVIAFQNSKKDGFFKDVNAEFKRNFNYVISYYEKHPEHNRFTVEYVRTVLREQLNYPIGRQQCLIYMSRLGYKLVKPKKQNLITMSARIKRLKVRYFWLSTKLQCPI